MLKLKTATRVGRIPVGSGPVRRTRWPRIRGQCLLVGHRGRDLRLHGRSEADPRDAPRRGHDPSDGRPEALRALTVDRTGKAYTDRLWERQAALRERAAAQTPAVSAGPMATGGGAGLSYSIPFIGGGSPGGHRGAQMQLPLGALGDADSDEPITVESVRMQPTEGAATRHWTIVKQGDRVISVIKGENRDRSPEGQSESDFDF